jgi:hypothetical protein
MKHFHCSPFLFHIYINSINTHEVRLYLLTDLLVREGCLSQCVLQPRVGSELIEPRVVVQGVHLLVRVQDGVWVAQQGLASYLSSPPISHRFNAEGTIMLVLKRPLAIRLGWRIGGWTQERQWDARLQLLQRLLSAGELHLRHGEFL